MASGNTTRPRGTTGDPVTLSTGHTVELPLSTRATMTGAVLSASREAVRELLPDALTPIRATPSRAAVTFLCVEYDRIGHGSGIEPYDEFGVLLPAVHDGSSTLPYLSALTRGVGGFVRYLPVTTEPARALGAEIWGYPKAVTEIDHEDDGSTRHTSVEVDGRSLIEIEVDRPPTVEQTRSGVSYTTKDGDVLCERLELDGRIGAWPCSDGVSYTLGDHPRARELAELDPGDRALLRFAAETEFVIHEGGRVGTV